MVIKNNGKNNLPNTCVHKTNHRRKYGDAWGLVILALQTPGLWHPRYASEDERGAVVWQQLSK
jgi:hypothetical protein